MSILATNTFDINLSEVSEEYFKKNGWLFVEEDSPNYPCAMNVITYDLCLTEDDRAKLENGSECFAKHMYMTFFASYYFNTKRLVVSVAGDNTYLKRFYGLRFDKIVVNNPSEMDIVTAIHPINLMHRLSLAE